MRKELPRPRRGHDGRNANDDLTQNQHTKDPSQVHLSRPVTRGLGAPMGPARGAPPPVKYCECAVGMTPWA